jgi:oligopeptidase B
VKHTAVLTSLILAAGLVHAENVPQPPVAAKADWKETRHGEVVTDDYRWLHKKTDKSVIDYLNAENAYTEAMTRHLEGLSDKVYGEIKGRMKEVDLSVPVRDGSFYYFSRTEAGKQYPIYGRRKAGTDGKYDDKAAEEVLLNVNEMAEGHKFFAVGDQDISDNEQLLAYTTDNNGFRQYKLQIKDLRTGKLLADTAERVTSIAWASDNKTLFFVQEDPVTKRSDRLFRLVLGGKPEQIRFESDELYSLDISRSRDKRQIMMLARSTDTTENWMLAADRPMERFTSVLGRRKGHRYYVSPHNDQLFIMTNRDARNFRVVSAPLANPHQWTEVVKHDRETLVNNIAPFEKFLVVGEKSRAQSRLRIYDFGTKKWKTVQFDDPVYTVRTGATPEFKTQQLRISYQSPITPPTVLDVDMASGKRTVLKRQEIVGGYDASKYETKRLWFKARDGVDVPMWIVHRKGVQLDGKNPTLLYSYGSYGIPVEPSFSIARLSLLDRGVVFAMSHIRGGNDMGEHWHEDGMLMKKKNTFTDFIDSAEYLVKQKWTNPDRLVIQGGSAGGLLMGAVVNMRPDLFKGVHAAVPFMDVMNTMMDSTLPLTVGEYLEWGNPNEKAAYDYMKSYSPYDNIARKAYPSMLVTTGLNDSQVMYWEPAKYVAKLRAHKTDNNQLLLKTNMGAGHGGASGRYNAVKESAFQYAWMLGQWGIKE